MFFYAWWDWRFLALIGFSAILDYFLSIRIEKAKSRNTQKVLLTISIFVNLGFLAFFKYYNFFIGEFASMFEHFGFQPNINSLNLILPVGISFYTFQTMSYTIDVYKKTISASRDFISYFLYVSFFPQLVAGPIERAGNILPQLERKRLFSYPATVNGLKQILWGLFKKVVIADNCASIVDQVFAHPENMNGSSLAIGAILFTIQIYADFSAYSDIAIGSARLFGIRLMKNFDFPLFAQSIPNFWRRWHISLMNWFRDYIYIPLGGSKKGNVRHLFNIFLVFFLSGLWHGANWTFIAFGLVHAMAYYLYLFNRRILKIPFPKVFTWLWTFIVVVVGFTFFRANSIAQAFEIMTSSLDVSLFSKPNFKYSLSIFMVFGFFMLLEYLGRKSEYTIEYFLTKQKGIRWALYYLLLFLMFYFYNNPNQFIYFQF